MKCISCPVQAGHPCYSAALPTLCTLAASGDAVMVQHVVNRSLIAEGIAPVPGVTTAPVPAAPCPPPVPSNAFAITKAVRECPHRSNAQCGCEGLADCALGKGRAGVVSISDCYECASAATGA